MAITKAPTRKPDQAKAGTASVSNERDIQALINKGGSVPTEKASSGEDLKKVQLRLSQTTIEEIDATRQRSKPGLRPSRHAWILAAIEEKLEREK